MVTTTLFNGTEESVTIRFMHAYKLFFYFFGLPNLYTYNRLCLLFVGSRCRPESGVKPGYPVQEHEQQIWKDLTRKRNLSTYTENSDTYVVEKVRFTFLSLCMWILLLQAQFSWIWHPPRPPLRRDWTALPGYFNPGLKADNPVPHQIEYVT